MLLSLLPLHCIKCGLACLLHRLKHNTFFTNNCIQKPVIKTQVDIFLRRMEYVWITQMMEVTATHINAIRRSNAFAINPISTGPTRKAAMPKVFIVAKPAPAGRPGTLAAAAKRIGEATETPSPVV